MSDLVSRLAAEQLVECEAVIERGLATFVEVGEALLCIRDERLYRADYATFEEYCRERWGMGRAHAYRLIGAAEVAGVVSPIGDIGSEAVARELVPTLREQPEEVREVWAEAVERHGDSPTAKQVRDIVKAKPGLGNYSKLDNDHAVDPWDGDVVFSFQTRQRIRNEVREVNLVVVDRLRNSTRQGAAASPAGLATEVVELHRAIQQSRTTHGAAHDVTMQRVQACYRQIAASAILLSERSTAPPDLKRGEKSSTDTYKAPI